MKRPPKSFRRMLLLLIHLLVVMVDDDASRSVQSQAKEIQAGTGATLAGYVDSWQHRYRATATSSLLLAAAAAVGGKICNAGSISASGARCEAHSGLSSPRPYLRHFPLGRTRRRLTVVVDDHDGEDAGRGEVDISFMAY